MKKGSWKTLIKSFCHEIHKNQEVNYYMMIEKVEIKIINDEKYKIYYGEWRKT